MPPLFITTLTFIQKTWLCNCFFQANFILVYINIKIKPRKIVFAKIKKQKNGGKCKKLTLIFLPLNSSSHDSKNVYFFYEIWFSFGSDVLHFTNKQFFLTLSLFLVEYHDSRFHNDYKAYNIRKIQKSRVKYFQQTLHYLILLSNKIKTVLNDDKISYFINS